MVHKGLLRVFRERERAEVLALAELESARSVIDVGCGAGFYALTAKAMGRYVCAVDATSAMLEGLSGRVDEMLLADVEEDLPLGRTFDRVICAGVLDFTMSPARALANLASLVAPGGRIVVSIPRVSAGGTFYRFEKWVRGMRVNLFTEQWVRETSAECDLLVADLRHPLPSNMAVCLVPRGERASDAPS
jgi:SAM-dependent methyltransferase